MKKIGLLVILSISLTSCFRTEEEKVELIKVAFSNSCEPNQLWTNEHLVKDIGNDAHSGTKAYVITESDEYGTGISLPLSKATNSSTLKKINVSFWIKTNKLPLTASFVNSVDVDSNLFWEGISLKEMVKDTNKWVFIQFQKEFPKIENTQAKISSYIWNPSKESFIIDDLNVSYEALKAIPE